jgi:fructokinase
MTGGPGSLRLGIDLGGTKIEALLLGDDGREHWRRRVATPAGDYGATIDAIAALVAEARVVAGGVPVPIGIGTPGAAMPDGRMKNCNSTCLNGRPLAADLHARLAQPVHLANDANCLALSEATDGAGAGAAVVFAAILGTGTGAGIVAHGRLLEGPNRLAGEWGHVPLPWFTPDDMLPADAGRPVRCWCGQRGCIEALVSGPALAAGHAARHGGTARAEDIARAAARGDAASIATLDRHAGQLARALALVVNLLDPDVIVLGGGLSRLPGLVGRVQARWAAFVFAGGVPPDAAAAPRTPLRLSAHGDASGVRGAAWLTRTP